MVTCDAFLIRVVHAGETHEGNTSYAKRERCYVNWLIQTQVNRTISRLTF